ncbi:class I SAM-dependent methyltransferase, partial [Candidatus Woesearchaeota archaeon]|nr:class I SAM-dependent methyltransferase [Candidatus Woesearchaeota archaeon]
MGTWESIFKSHGRVFFKPQEDMSKIIRLLRKEGVKRVLDLGCGTGRHTVMLAEAGFDVYGTDISKEGLNLTRKWLKESNLKAKLKQSSCYKKFPFKNKFFDAIISIQVIHHAKIKTIRYCISEIERVLKPGGMIFIT